MKQSEFEAQDWPTADEVVEQAKGKPDDAELQLRAAWGLYGESRYGDAQAFLENVLARFPTDVEVQYALGMARKKAGDDQGALQAFRSVTSSLGQAPESTRRRMLSRLAQGHINMLERGDWDLEELTWERK